MTHRYDVSDTMHSGVERHSARPTWHRKRVHIMTVGNSFLLLLKSCNLRQRRHCHYLTSWNAFLHSRKPESRIRIISGNPTRVPRPLTGGKNFLTHGRLCYLSGGMHGSAQDGGITFS